MKQNKGKAEGLRCLPGEIEHRVCTRSIESDSLGRQNRRTPSLTVCALNTSFWDTNVGAEWGERNPTHRLSLTLVKPPSTFSPDVSLSPLVPLLDGESTYLLRVCWHVMASGPWFVRVCVCMRACKSPILPEQHGHFPRNLRRVSGFRAVPDNNEIST